MISSPNHGRSHFDKCYIEHFDRLNVAPVEMLSATPFDRLRMSGSFAIVFVIVYNNPDSRSRSPQDDKSKK